MEYSLDSGPPRASGILLKTVMRGPSGKHGVRRDSHQNSGHPSLDQSVERKSRQAGAPLWLLLLFLSSPFTFALEFLVTTIDNDATSRAYTSLTVIDGHPAIVYRAGSEGELRYTIASDLAGSQWKTPVPVVTNTSVRWITLINIGGRPAISYHDETQGTVNFIRAKDASGDAWGEPSVVARMGSLKTPNDGPSYISTVVVGGLPAIAFIDLRTRNVQFTRATNVEATDWTAPLEIHNRRVAYSLSMAAIGGRPAIAYRFAQAPASLRYTRANDRTGTSWPTAQIVNDTQNPASVSLAEVNGRPAISFENYSTKQLWYVRALDHFGSAWGEPIKLDEANTCQHTILRVVDRLPMISYRASQPLESARLVQALDPNGNTWTESIIVDSDGDAGRFNSLISLNQRVALSYQAQGSNSVRYAYESDAAVLQTSKNRNDDTPFAVSEEQEEVRNYAGAAVIGLLVAGGIIAYWMSVKRHNAAIEKNRGFARRLIDLQEIERQRLASELHDGIGQDLLLLKKQALMLLNKADQDSKQHVRLKSMSGSISASLEDARAAISELHPYELKRLGLAEALEAIARRISETHSLQIEFESPPLQGACSAETEVHLFRIVQEALTNIVKHSSASRVKIRIVRHETLLRIEIEDDGKGFDDSNRGGSDGTGLAASRERARWIGGEYSIHSTPGKGTTITITVPLKLVVCENWRP